MKPTAYSVGGEITLRLMRRERGALEAVPVEQWDLRPSVALLSVSESAVDTVYAKLLLANTSDVSVYFELTGLSFTIVNIISQEFFWLFAGSGNSAK